jgi:hypothetical protein
VYELWEIVSHAMQAALQNITHQFLKTWNVSESCG